MIIKDLGPSIDREICKIKDKQIRKLQADLALAREGLEFVVNNSGTSTDYNFKAREILAQLDKKDGE